MILPLLPSQRSGIWDKTLLKGGLGKGRRRAAMVFPLLHSWGVAAGVLGSDSPPQAGHAVHSHAAAGVLAELGLQQVEPIFHNLAGRRRSIIKWPILQGWEERNAVKTQEKLSGCFYSGCWCLGPQQWGSRRVPGTGHVGELCSII